jgi:hypothetical protein
MLSSITPHHATVTGRYLFPHISKLLIKSRLRLRREHEFEAFSAGYN